MNRAILGSSIGLAHSTSISGVGAPETPTAPIIDPPASIITPPPSGNA